MIKNYTQTLLGQEARDALKCGIDRVHAPVAVTIGAKGRNGILNEYGYPKPTNDGVTIARNIRPYNEFERMGAQLIQQVAEETVLQAGDGTTTAIIVAHSLAEGGMEAIKNGKDPMEFRAELEIAKDEVVAAIKKMAIPVKSRNDILNIAKVSVEDDEMAEMVADAVEKAGKHGAVIVEEGSGYGLEKEEVAGYHWDRGYVSPYMITNPEKDEAVFENVAVLITDRYMNLNKDLVQTLDEMKRAGVGSAFIIVDRMEGELLQTLIINKVKGIFPTVVVSKPPTLDELEDIATLCNGTAITKDKGIKQITYAHAGKASRIIVTKDKTTIIADSSPALEARVVMLQELIKNEKDDVKKESFISRLAKLTDGMVIIRVGAKTEAERRYRKDKMDDAVSAAKAATEEGIVPGGGVTLNKIALSLLENNPSVGAKILAHALTAPFRKILENAGIKDTGKSYNVKTGKVVKDMIDEGIIDPAKVARCVVENSVSFAGTFCTIESVTANFTEESVQK